MMVTFVSQCEKNALIKTRRVLDTFANRIGNNTWQTVITNEGLQAVKALLRKTASKNTAVSCHWARSRSRSELVWIVGNRSKFNPQGIVPVNTTQKTIMNTQWENDWHYLPLIKSLTALAALFHDWGKSSELFQEKLKRENSGKLKGDPLRHEWISALFFNAFVNGETDEQWLSRLAAGNITAKDLEKLVKEKHHKQKNKNKPLKELPNAASLLAWLIVSHHRLPGIKENQGQPLSNHQALFSLLEQKWGYENKFNEREFKENLERCFVYQKGLPSDSDQWLSKTKKYANKLIICLPLLEQCMADGTWRLVLHYSRLSLMLGDHNYSSKDADPHWNSQLDLYANTDGVTKKPKQKLDEHLVGVADQALRNTHLLPAFEGKHEELQRAYDVKVLAQKSPLKYQWQDTAVTKINAWRLHQAEKLDTSHFGFFTVNMASTGKGKTFANAKIMRALSVDGESLRYILALGLRTLTLQTGDEYRERIKLAKDELAVLIGSRAVMELHSKNKEDSQDETYIDTGSESEETLLDNELYFESEIPEGGLSTVLRNNKDRQFLYAPVLSCTIDHLMAATETKRGGRYILPSLRLMSSDLVIDEIDDFDGTDLIAIGRLIHLAGMLGRKVMISSATISPDLAEGYYNAYQSGWALFANMRKRSSHIGCAWVDEFGAQIQTINCTPVGGVNEYQQQHQKFVVKRIKELEKQPVKRKATIVPCELLAAKSNQDETNRQHFYSIIQAAILEKHHHNHVIDRQSGKCVSFGVVRVANISPCIELTRYLLGAQWPEDVEIRTMAYHSQQLLIMRNEQEKHLDAVLKRDKGEQASFAHPLIRKHLQQTDVPNVLFILVATPVEEVGRDHDFDWAVIEPSSFRSFIQLAGRVMRHREIDGDIQSSNIAILQRNLRSFLNDNRPVFCYPGYETGENKLETHDLAQLVDADVLAKRLDSSARISKPIHLKPKSNLADLEHQAIHQRLTNYVSRGPESMQGWLEGCWWLTSTPQLYASFRDSSPQLTMYLTPFDDGWKFAAKDQKGQPCDKEKTYGICRASELSAGEEKRLWLHRDYSALLEALGKSSLQKAALTYGEIGLPVYGKENLNELHFTYSSQLGLSRN